MLVMPSDHVIADIEAFHAAVDRAASAARAGSSSPSGSPRARAETGYGYIDAGDAGRRVRGVFAVARFLEKPAAADAGAMSPPDDHFWNSGIFLFRGLRLPRRARADEARHARRLRRAVGQGRAATPTSFVSTKPRSRPARPNSIDYAVMEHTARSAVVPVDMGWSDLGSWDALWETGNRDATGNALVGNVFAEDTRNCYLRSEAGLVAAIGIEDLVVVATADAVMVAPRNRAQDVRTPRRPARREGRDEADALPTVHRPGAPTARSTTATAFRSSTSSSSRAASCRCRCTTTAPSTGSSSRAPRGSRRGDEEIMLTEDQSTYIPLGTPHRLENPGKIPLHLIEVQSGELSRRRRHRPLRRQLRPRLTGLPDPFPARAGLSGENLLTTKPDRAAK